jgi:8-oxo-dGTP pyrophosphatase MutT (NUDIX family)
MTMRELHKARLVVLDPLDRVLLFRVSLATSERYWITPGGELHPGESHEDAARRELREETGFEDFQLGQWLWEREVLLAGRLAPLLLRERYFLVRLPVAAPGIRHDRRTDEESVLLDEDRWWTVAELRDTRETVYPPDLAALLEPILRGELPETPLKI